MRKIFLLGLIGLMGFNSLMAQNGTWTVYDTRTSDICGNNISAITADDNLLWAGSYQGLCRLKGNTWTDYAMFNEKLKGQSVNCLMVDNRGVHETRYLPNPTPLKLILRLKAPQMPAEGQVLEISSRQIAWKDIARVQLWPEKCMVLFYAPSWWLRIPVVCTPFTWEDTMEYIREKLGRKRKVRLPQSLTVQAPAASRRRAAAYREPETVQIRMDETDLAETLPAAEEPGAESGENLT